MLYETCIKTFIFFFTPQHKTERSILNHLLILHPSVLPYFFRYSFFVDPYLNFIIIIFFLHSYISPSFCISCSRTLPYFHVCPLPFFGYCADFLIICGFDQLYADSMDIHYLSLNSKNCFEFNLIFYTIVYICHLSNAVNFFKTIIMM